MAERRNGQLELKYDDLEYKLETKKVEESTFNNMLGALIKIPKPDKN